MKLVSLEQKYSDMQRPEMDDGCCPTFTLDAKQIDALGLTNAKAGAEMKMVANICISHKSESDDGMRCMTIEIEEAGCEMKQPEKSAASILFPDD